MINLFITKKKLRAHCVIICNSDVFNRMCVPVSNTCQRLTLTQQRDINYIQLIYFFKLFLISTCQCQCYV